MKGGVLSGGLCSCCLCQSHGGHYLVGSTGQTIEGVPGLLIRFRLAQDVPVKDHRSVRDQHQIVRILRRHGPGFLPGHTLDIGPGRFSLCWRFVDVRRLHPKTQANLCQQFGAAG